MGTAITYRGHDVFSSAYAVYQPILSGRVGPVLIRGKIGIDTERWFAPKVPVSSWLEGRFLYLSTYLTVIMGNYFGRWLFHRAGHSGMVALCLGVGQSNNILSTTSQ